MREHAKEIEQAGFQIVTVAPAKHEHISPFVEEYGPFPFVVVGDPEKEAYKGLGHPSITKAKLALQLGAGFVTGKTKHLKPYTPKTKHQRDMMLTAVKEQDYLIQGGTWIVSGLGDVLWKHIDKEPGDHARIEVVVDEVKKLSDN